MPDKVKCFKDEWLNELFSEYIRSAYPSTPDFREWEKENSEPSGDYYGFLVKLFRKAYEKGRASVKCHACGLPDDLGRYYCHHELAQSRQSGRAEGIDDVEDKLAKIVPIDASDEDDDSSFMVISLNKIDNAIAAARRDGRKSP